MRASQYEGIALRKIIPFSRATSAFEPRLQPEYAPTTMPTMTDRRRQEDHEGPDQFLSDHVQDRPVITQRIPPVALEDAEKIAEILLDKGTVEAVRMIICLNDVGRCNDVDLLQVLGDVIPG